MWSNGILWIAKKGITPLIPHHLKLRSNSRNSPRWKESWMRKFMIFSSRRKWGNFHYLVPPSPRKLGIVFDIDERNCIVGREVTLCDAIDALNTSQIVLEAVKRDLQSINQSLVAAKSYLFFHRLVMLSIFLQTEQLINMADHSVSRVHRVAKRAIKVDWERVRKGQYFNWVGTKLETTVSYSNNFSRALRNEKTNPTKHICIIAKDSEIWLIKGADWAICQ